MTNFTEDAPANAAGSGAVAGLGVGPQGEPPGPRNILANLRRKKLEQEEKWSQEYKKSIDCNNPKGFSQKAHCAGRKIKKLNETDKELLPGYSIKHKIGDNNEHHYTIHHNDKEVGEARLSHTGKHVVDLSIHKEHRRKGLATALYNHIEKHLGYKLSPSPTYQTPEGKAFWASRQTKKESITEATFAGHEVFVVPSEYYHKCRMGKHRHHRYEKYVGNDEIGETIRQYGRKNHKKPIIVQDEKTGAMTYLRYGGNYRKDRT